MLSPTTAQWVRESGAVPNAEYLLEVEPNVLHYEILREERKP